MAEYGSMFSVSILASILFLGGWHGPIPVTEFLGLSPENGPVLGYLGQLIGAVNVIGKGVIAVCVMMWIRWTLPRLRIDQVMATCLKYCTPLAAAMFLGATIWQLQLPGKAFFGLMDVSPSVYAIGDGGSAAKPAELEIIANDPDQIARTTLAAPELAQKGL